MNKSTIAYIAEIRNKLIKVVSVNIAILIGLVFWSKEIYEIIATPLINTLPKTASMIATDITSPLFVPLKLTIATSFLISLPYIMHQIWVFIMPALYRKERKLTAIFILITTILFYSGIAFGFFVICPIIFNFFSGISIANVEFATDISKYLSFILKLLFGCGLAFEVPIVVIAAILLELTTITNIKTKRPYVVVIAFIVGMMLTPPDIISQTLLAVPMILLFELGIILGMVLKNNYIKRIN